jgi:uncharacterized membrane-anchored protein
MRMRVALCLVAVLAFGARVSADDNASLPKGWTPGPVSANLAGRATISIPEGYYYLDAPATKRLLTTRQTTSDGSELGTILRVGESGSWFAVFSHAGTGHIDDGDQNALDPEALLTALQGDNQRVNAQRAEHGWAARDLQAWHRPPSYSVATNRLTWSTRLVSGEDAVINYDVRLLGRDGVMSVRLVTDPDSVLLSTSQFVEVMLTYAFNDGFRYGDFVAGEPVASSGLATLIVSGHAPTAVEGGYFPGFWMGIIFAVVVSLIGAKVLFGRREEQPVLAGAPPSEFVSEPEPEPEPLLMP